MPSFFRAAAAAVLALALPPAWGLAVHINTATAQQLDALPGIGPAMAQRIVQARAAAGPFRGPADVVQRVKGLGEKRLRRLVAAGLQLDHAGPGSHALGLPRAAPYTLEHEPHSPRPRPTRPPR